MKSALHYKMASNILPNRLEVVLGSMYSGKSSYCMRILTQFSDLGLKALYINHQFDNRSDTNFSTHSSLIAQEVGIDTLKLCEFKGLDVKKYDLIAIDEAQFFGGDLISFVLHLVDDLKKFVIVAGLDGTFERKKFGFLLDLIPYADFVTKLTAVCRNCVQQKLYNQAIYSHRMSNTTNEIEIGGSEKYEAVCRTCFLFLESQQKQQGQLDKNFC